jgi:hypothetical protein
MATHCLDHGIDIRHVRELLRHTSLAATQKYLHVSVVNLQKLHRKFFPWWIKNEKRNRCTIGTKITRTPKKTLDTDKLESIVYARVSTANNGQDPMVQVRELREYCEHRGWKIASEYVDVGISGSKEKRLELDRLMTDVHFSRFDYVVVWKFWPLRALREPPAPRARNRVRFVLWADGHEYAGGKDGVYRLGRSRRVGA